MRLADQQEILSVVPSALRTKNSMVDVSSARASDIESEPERPCLAFLISLLDSLSGIRGDTGRLRARSLLRWPLSALCGRP